MIAVISRILLRYAAGAMVAAGYLDSNVGQQIGADPDLLIIVGTGLGTVAEIGYTLAKKFGRTT